MSAALIELVSKGVQDVFLTGQPEVSFYRQNYKRYTNFAMKPERIDYIGTFGASNEVTIPIKSKGDLLTYVWVEATNIGSSGANAPGFFSSDATSQTEFALYIGGQKVVTLDALYVQGVHNVLYNDTQSKTAFAVGLNNIETAAVGAGATGCDHYVLPFFFSDDWTKALPLVALQYHEVEIRIKCRGGGTPFVPVGVPRVYANYVYLDTDERAYFTDKDHELLINQVQYQLMTATDTDADLTYFNHPCKAVHIVNGAALVSVWSTGYTFKTATLYINGTPLFEDATAEYHHTVVPHMHTSYVPPLVTSTTPVYTWPFCLTMNKSQPTGSLNFSRIDNAKIQINGPTGGAGGQTRVYGVNYNILRIKAGMAGIAFSN